MGKDSIYATLLGRIESGSYPAGSRMPAGRELAKEFGVTHWAMHNTMLKLEEDGFVESRPPVGIFVRNAVAPDKVRRRKNSLAKTVSILVARDFFFTRYGYEDIIGDLERRLEPSGIDVVYNDMPENAKELDRFLDSASASGTRALVCFPGKKEWEALHLHKNIFLRHPVDIFYFNRGQGPIDSLPFNCVGVDMFSSGALAAKWTLDRKIEHVAYISEPHSSYWIVTRQAGFHDEMSRAGRPFQFFAEQTPEQNMRHVLDFIKKSPSPPAVVACNDTCAAPIYNGLAAHNLESGRDYYMVSFDNQPTFRSCKFVTVAWPLDKVGAIFSDAIVNAQRANNQDSFYLKYLLKPLIIDRTTK